MTLKDLLIQEIDSLSDPLMSEVLDFLRALKVKQVQNDQPSEVVQSEALPKANPAGQPDYPLQGEKPYRYDDPFAPAVPLKDWDVLQ